MIYLHNVKPGWPEPRSYGRLVCDPLAAMLDDGQSIAGVALLTSAPGQQLPPLLVLHVRGQRTLVALPPTTTAHAEHELLPDLLAQHVIGVSADAAALILPRGRRHARGEALVLVADASGAVASSRAAIIRSGVGNDAAEWRRDPTTLARELVPEAMTESLVWLHGNVSRN